MKKIDFASHTSHWVMGVGLSLLVGACVQETTTQARLPIIDVHMHAFPTLGGPPLEEMDRYNIVLGFLSPGGPGSDEDEVFEWVDAVPRRFIASPGVGDPGAAVGEAKTRSIAALAFARFAFIVALARQI